MPPLPANIFLFEKILLAILLNMFENIRGPRKAS